MLELRAKLSVPVNGVFVPLTEAIASIRRFCAPAFFHHHELPEFQLARAGTALLLRYRGRNLALCTRHQLGGGAAQTDPERFTVTLTEAGGARLGLGPDVVTRVRMDHPAHGNLEDVLVLEYRNERNGRDIRGLFLDLDVGRNLETIDHGSVKAMFAIGYPTAFTDVDFVADEEGNPVALDMTLRWVKLYLALAAPAPMDTENRRPMVQDPNADQETIEPDGMSGAPVFFVCLDRGVACLGFGGIVTEARERRYMVYDGDLLRRILDQYVDGP